MNEEIDIVKSTTSDYIPELEKVMTSQEINILQNTVRKIPVADNVIQYAVKLVGLTRPDIPHAPEYIKNWVNWGAGPRASQYLILGAKTKAALEGRFTPEIDDVKACAIPVLRHRIVTNFTAEAEGITPVTIIEKLMEEKFLK
jgi:MoxR-like ATPase